MKIGEAEFDEIVVVWVSSCSSYVFWITFPQIQKLIKTVFIFTAHTTDDKFYIDRNHSQTQVTIKWMSSQMSTSISTILHMWEWKNNERYTHILHKLSQIILNSIGLLIVYLVCVGANMWGVGDENQLNFRNYITTTFIIHSFFTPLGEIAKGLKFLPQMW